MLALILCLVLGGLVLAGCKSTDARHATETAADIEGLATETLTPAGDYLIINGEPVLQVLIPAPSEPALYAVTATHLYRRKNDRWEMTATTVTGRYYLADPTDNQRLFRGDHPVCTDQSGKEIPFGKSQDGGDTWRSIQAGYNIKPIAIDPHIEDVMYGSDCGLAISTNAGETWKPYYRTVDHDVVSAIAVGERLLVLEKFISGGARLRQIDITVPENPELAETLLETSGVFALDADQDRIVVGTSKGVELSLDGGKTWNVSRVGIEDVTVGEGENPPPNATETEESDYGVLAVRLDPTHSKRIFAGTVSGLFISQDNGVTWDRYQAARFDSHIHEIQLAAESRDLYLTTNEGISVIPNP